MAKKKRKMTARTKTTAKSSRGARKRTKTKSTKKNTARRGNTTNRVIKAVKKARTKSDIMGVIAANTGLAKREVSTVFDNIQELINFDLGKNGPGVFNFPGLMKIVKISKPATKARKGINPFTKEPMMFKAKPAHSVVKVRALKTLKEMVR